MPKSTTPAPESTELAVVASTPALDLVREILDTVPQADEDPTPRMEEFILSHPPEEWDELWKGLPNVKENGGAVVTVHAIRARESDFEGGIGIYLIADVTWAKTRERGLLSCSSKMAMLQLLRLHAESRFPATVEIVKKEKATKRGFHPIHLRYLVNYRDPVVSEQ